MGGGKRTGPGVGAVILLDTHVLLWLRVGNARLGPRARQAIDEAWQAGEVCVSAISFWEVALLIEKGRVRFPEDVSLWRQEQLAKGMVEIPVSGAIGIRAALLAGFPRDPADRLIVATTLEGHRLVTADERILAWPGKLDRLRATV